MSPGPRGWRRLLFSLVPVLLLLLGGEALARLLEARDPAPTSAYLLPPSPTRMWALSPGAVMGGGPGAARVGPDGLRAVRSTGAPHRALTLGDSNVFGHDLPDPDTLHVALATALRAHGVQADVFCGGVPGYSTEQSLVLLDEVGWDLQPQLLVVANLLSDSTEERFQDRATLAALAARAPDPAFRSALMRSLSLWIDPPSRAERNISWARPTGLVRRPRVPAVDYAENLRRIAGEAARRGASVIFLELATVRSMSGEADAQAWRLAMRETATRLDLPLVDGAAALRAAGLDAQTAFIDPVHVGAAGNRAYAEALAETQVRAGWPSSPRSMDRSP